MSKFRADITFAASVLILTAFGLFFGGRLIVDPPIALDRDILAMNPRVFPTLILAFTMLTAFIFLATERKKGSLVVNTRTESAASTLAALYRQIIFIGITVTCALLLTKFGFLATMFLLMASTSLLVGNRNPLQIFGVSLVFPLSFYIIVTYMLRTQLPEADIVERTLATIIQVLNKT